MKTIYRAVSLLCLLLCLSAAALAQTSGGSLTGTVTDTMTTVLSVDAATSSYTRTRALDSRVDGFTINKPRDGLRYRAAGTSATTSGGSVNYSEIIAMPLSNTGLNVYVSVAANQSFFGVSVNHD